MEAKERKLQDLISIGPAMVRDFELLGVRSVADLARQDPDEMYRKLGRVAKQHQDICVLDTFRAGVAQARDPRLPAEQCQWWWWSEQRKSGKVNKQPSQPRTQSSEKLEQKKRTG
jgi:nucleotidyltransferase/DNA polymerase involved in DNA repair